jgi:hypothetical protein
MCRWWNGWTKHCINILTPVLAGLMIPFNDLTGQAICGGGSPFSFQEKQ